MNDFYGDKGSCEYPKLEEINVLFFKLNGKDGNLFISKNDQQIMVNKIRNLDIGLVEISSVQSFSRYISIRPHEKEVVKSSMV
jgi:hypothetical protein